MAHRNYVFTHHVHCADEANQFIVEMKHLLEKAAIKGAVFQLEVAPTTGQHHFQGYLELPKPHRISGVKKLFQDTFNSIHLEVRHGSRSQAVDYSSKEATRCTDLGSEWPHPGPYYLPSEDFFSRQQQGSRNDLTAVYEYIQREAESRRVTWEDVLGEFPRAAIQYHVGVTRALAAVNSRHVGVEDFQPRPWQYDLLLKLADDPHPREILWYWDERGNTGKSYFARYLVGNIRADYYSGGKTVDIAHACTGASHQVFDFTRSNEGFIPYDAIERLKNGMVFSPKYESGTKVFAVPHVLIFANFPPDKEKLSADRWCIVKIVTV